MSKEVMYYAKLRLGQGHRSRLLYLQSLEWVGDQIVFTLSDDQCEVPGSFLSAFSEVLSAAKRCPSMQFSLITEEVPGSREASDLSRDYSHLEQLYRKYGQKFFSEFLAKVGGDS